jgi:hypothetical protein
MSVAAASNAKKYEFIRPSSTAAMVGYDQIEADLGKEIDAMNMEIGFLNCPAGRKVVGTRLDKCMGLLESAEKTAEKAKVLFKRMAIAEALCPAAGTHGSADRELLIKLSKALKEEGSKCEQIHETLIPEFRKALASACYNYLNDRNQMYKAHKATWWLCSYSITFNQYKSYRDKEPVL